MATLVSQPPILYTSLRALEYKFSMPSIGVDPVEKFLRYRLRSVSDNAYLTDWKYYRPVVNGQQIIIDFYKDLFGVNRFDGPPFGLPPVVFADPFIIKTIEVEYGERSVDKSNGCEITDTTDGTTAQIDVIPGLWKPWESQFPITGFIMSNRPKLYEIHFGSSDYLYIAGSYNIELVYHDSSDAVIGGDTFTIVQTFPGSIVSIVPIGFQIATAGTERIRVYAKQSGSINIPGDHYCTIHGRYHGCEETSLYDVYFVNHKAGIDLMSFDCAETKDVSVAKEYITTRYDKSLQQPWARGQKKTNRNISEPTLYFKKQFERLVFRETEWLDSFVSSSHAWLRHHYGTSQESLMRVNIVDGSYQTYGEEVELTVGLQFSEELIQSI